MRALLIGLVFLSPCLQAFRRLAPEFPGIGMIPYSDVSVPIFAALLSLSSWFTSPSSSLAKSPLILASLSIAIASCTWTAASEIGRGAIITCSLICPVLISTCLESPQVRFKYTLLLVIGNVIQSIAMVAMSFKVGASRLGYIYSDGARSDPNVFGFEMSVTLLIVLTFLIPSCDSMCAGSCFAVILKRTLYLATGLFLMCLLFTASRGALLSFVFGYLAHWLLGKLTPLRLIFTMCVACASASALMVEIPAFQQITDRVMDRRAFADMGSRTFIWHAGMVVLEESWLTGRGIGGVDSALAENVEPGYSGIIVGTDGVSRLFSHNGYIEWFIATGIIGVFVGVLAVTKTGIVLIKRDLTRGESYRTSLLMALLVYSISGVAYRDVIFVPIATILLASVSPSLHSMNGFTLAGSQYFLKSTMHSSLLVDAHRGRRRMV